MFLKRRYKLIKKEKFLCDLILKMLSQRYSVQRPNVLSTINMYITYRILGTPVYRVKEPVFSNNKKKKYK